jgi:molybdate transport system ATP-binding protein
VIEARFRLPRAGFTLDVDLRLPSAGVSAVFGPSGCGKTTLLRCLAGLERAPEGRLVVGGQTWQDGRQFVPPHRRAVGLVFQDAALFPHLTVRANLDFGRRRIPGEQARPALDATIELLGIGGLLDRWPASLSGGERQRVAIARALAMAPRMLLLDEPMAALDARRKHEILPYLDRLHRELTLPVVYVTHALAEVTRLADHLVLMDRGRAVASGALFDLQSHPALGLAADDEAAVVLPCAVGARDPHWHLARIDFDGGSLWVRDAGYAVGQAARVRVLARDVSLATVEPQGSSIVNHLAGVVLSVVDESHPANAMVRVRVGGSTLLARVTRLSADRLGLAAGMPVWVLVKSVALGD